MSKKKNTRPNHQIKHEDSFDLLDPEQFKRWMALAEEAAQEASETPVVRFVNDLHALQSRWAERATESADPLERYATRALTSIIAALAFGDEQKLAELSKGADTYRRECLIKDLSQARHGLARQYSAEFASGTRVGDREWKFKRATNFALPSRAEFLSELWDIYEATRAGGVPLADAMGPTDARHAFLVAWLLQHWECLDTGKLAPLEQELSDALKRKGATLEGSSDPHTQVKYTLAACLNAAGWTDETQRELGRRSALETAKDWLRGVKRDRGGS